MADLKDVTATTIQKAALAVAVAFLAVGVLGGFTTYSTFALDVVALIGAGRAPLAVAYVLASVLGGVLAVVVGLVLGRAAVRATDTVDAELRAGEGET